MAVAVWGNAGRGQARGRRLEAVLAALLMACGPVAAVPVAHAADHHTIVVTFIRHGESQANAVGVIDTAVPGPDLTATGQQQAQQVADELSVNRYDGIWASTMVRTQETAAPMSQALGETVTVLPGLREIEAGTNEGLPVDSAPVNPAPGVWLHGDRAARIPGAISGTEFETRFNDALSTIYGSGETNPVVFSHGLAIFYWVLMNAKNAASAMSDPPLSNTAHVVVTGNPTDGWTLADWNGQPTPA
jgi:broad specificity phosphatase PhoE